ncbi:MAG: CDP-2,3-bis-(O-geranylgeranyl)-sn-glycerol synthase [Thaumarchaeota archaeon]|jgi:CDP-2,3-bis-(O-geranylgeranyl)-sn-glycerol synthase|nr:CDP-2,3-bis-(O-geranylgeranyl)-sn-glycerol synthase [Nitrososphaerota archaeon]
MRMLVQEMFELGIRGLIFYSSAYAANASALLFKGRRQIDLGKVFIDGKPIFGSGKTFKGFFLGLVVGVFTGSMVGNSVIVSFLTSLGALLGDLMGAFIKRRISIKPGDPMPVLDQFDFMLGATLLSQAWNHLDPRAIIIIMALTPAVHLISNFLAFLLKIKKVPW